MRHAWWRTFHSKLGFTNDKLESQNSPVGERKYTHKPCCNSQEHSPSTSPFTFHLPEEKIRVTKNDNYEISLFSVLSIMKLEYFQETCITYLFWKWHSPLFTGLEKNPKNRILIYLKHTAKKKWRTAIQHSTYAA